MTKRLTSQEFSEIYNEAAEDWMTEIPEIIECIMCGELYNYGDMVDGICVGCIPLDERQ
jgi:hypothetical protein